LALEADEALVDFIELLDQRVDAAPGWVVAISPRRWSHSSASYTCVPEVLDFKGLVRAVAAVSGRWSSAAPSATVLSCWSEVSLEIGKSRLAQRLTVWPRRDG
jgi:hypothetical protein